MASKKKSEIDDLLAQYEAVINPPEEAKAETKKTKKETSKKKSTKPKKEPKTKKEPEVEAKAQNLAEKIEAIYRKKKGQEPKVPKTTKAPKTTKKTTSKKTPSKKKAKPMTIDELVKIEPEYQESLRELLKNYIGELPEYEPLEGVCIPPSTKASYIKKLRSGIYKNVEEINKGLETGSMTKGEEERLKYEIIKKLLTLNELIKRTPECSVDEAKEAVERVIKEYPEAMGYEDFEDLLDIIYKEKTAAKRRRRGDMEKAQEEIAEEIAEEQGIDLEEASEDVKEDIYEEAEKLVPDKSLKEFTSRLHKAIYNELGGYMYDGAKGQKDHIASPCGIKIPMEGDEAIFKAEDILAFFGAGKDWIDYYHSGETEVIGDRFQPMSSKDWPGCWRNIFENNKYVTKEELKDAIKNTKKKLKLKDFVDVDELPDGYYSKE